MVVDPVAILLLVIGSLAIVLVLIDYVAIVLVVVQSVDTVLLAVGSIAIVLLVVAHANTTSPHFKLNFFDFHFNKIVIVYYTKKSLSNKINKQD